MQDVHPTHFGARPFAGEGRIGVEFTLWAPAARTVEIEIVPRVGSPFRRSLPPPERDLFTLITPDAAPGDRYRFRKDDGPFWPDPASRRQPDGVHGASEVVDPLAFTWTDRDWAGLRMDRLVLYELHVGTFTPAGTFDGVTARLPYLADLGVTAIELMPLAAFPGRWNWGYDGGALFAPSERYGSPDELRHLVDRAHALGLGVVIDLVYNHLGPDGAYLAAFAPAILRSDRDSPWGGALDLAVDTGRMVREFFIANAIHWAREYHMDGLRLDATHAIVDGDGEPFAAELARRVRGASPDRPVLVIAEDDRNLADIVRARASAGWGLNGVWADDFHHQTHVHLTGEREGYYADFTGDTADLASTVRDGWFYQGQSSPRSGRSRGTSPEGIPRERFIIALQNHDQIGNRARGERLHHLVDPQAFAAATALCLLAPETPLLFMGQEWGALSPFQYFTDHDEPLGSQVVAGRRREFASFAAFEGRTADRSVPSPQDPRTFERSRLEWDELTRPDHQRMLAFTRALLRTRRELLESGCQVASVVAFDTGSLVLEHVDRSGDPAYCTLIRLSGDGLTSADVSHPAADRAPVRWSWHVLWSSRPIIGGGDLLTTIRAKGDRLDVGFAGPGAVMFGRRLDEGCR